MKITNNRVLTLISLLFTINSFANTLTWTGGNGDWEDADKWDLGVVPDTDDIAIIPSGMVSIDGIAHVNEIILEGGELKVNGSLVVQPTIANSLGQYHGIEIQSNASFINNGLTVLIETIPVNGIARLIFNNGICINNEKGYIYMEGENFYGIHNYASGQFTNRGEIDIIDIENGIFSVSDIYNYGDIEISSTSTSITLQNLFYNASNAVLSTNNLISITNNALLNNFGEIEIDFENTFQGTAISIGGKLTSQNYSNISIEGAFVDALFIHTNGETRIKGNLQIQSVSPYSSALYLEGLFVNHQRGTINVSSGIGITVTPTGSCLNYGNWINTDAANGASRSLKVEGSFNNRPKGRLTFENNIVTTPGSTLNNQGHMFLQHNEDLDDIDGNFNNTACLNDLNGKIVSSINNLSIIVEPIQVTPEVNTPLPNALNLGTNLGATVLGWYTSATGNTLAGSYNSSTNTFTPNANAVGLSSVFVRTRINAGGITRRHELKFAAPIQFSITPNHYPNLIQEGFKTSISTYPNPAMNQLSVSTNENYELGDIKLINISGQLILNKYCDNSKNCDLEFSKDIPNGIYYLYINDKTGSMQSVEQIKIFR